MSAQGPAAAPKYRDPVGRDIITALDVSLLIPLTFFIEGVQADAVKARLAGLTVIAGVAAGLGAGLAVSPKWGVIAWLGASGAGWVLQVAFALRRRRSVPVTAHPASYIAATVSVVHYVTLVNFMHAEVARDRFVQLARVMIWCTHLVAGAMLVFVILVMVPINNAWGCYPTHRLRDYNEGPCGEDPALPWVRNHGPQSVCRNRAADACEPRHSPSQLFDRVFTVAMHAEGAALAVYTFTAFHIYTVYWKDLKTSLGTSAAFISNPLFDALLQ